VWWGGVIWSCAALPAVGGKFVFWRLRIHDPALAGDVVRGQHLRGHNVKRRPGDALPVYPDLRRKCPGHRHAVTITQRQQKTVPLKNMFGLRILKVLTWVTLNPLSKHRLRLSKMLYGTRSPLTHKMEPSEIQKVESLMTVPFNLLPTNQDRRDREMLGAQRTKEALSSVPFYANRAKKAALEGREWEYWVGFWRMGVNFLHPARASSTAKVADTPD